MLKKQYRFSELTLMLSPFRHDLNPTCMLIIFNINFICNILLKYSYLNGVIFYIVGHFSFNMYRKFNIEVVNCPTVK